MKRYLTFLLLFSALVCAAQNSLTVDAPRVVSSDETFRVVFTADGKMSDFNWPGTSDFDVVWGPQTGYMSSTNIVNGKRTSVHQETVTYLLQPKSEGKFTIAGASAKVDKKECSSGGFSIEVVGSQQQQAAAAAAQQSGSQAGQQNGNQQSRSSAGDPAVSGTVSGGDIFLKMTVNKTNVVKGEPVMATLKIYSRVDITAFEDIHFPTFNGFWSKETVSVQNLEFNRENVGGTIYNSALLRQYMLTPQQVGDLTIDPAEMVCQLRVRGSSGGGMRSIFDDFFDTYQTVRKRIATAPVTIHVKDLPAGAPASFGGGVGNFTMTARTSKKDVKSNEAASLIVTISGKGNIAMLETPKIDFPSDFEVYDVKTTDKVSNDGTSGSKTFEFPFIPRSHGEFTIPSIQYSFYNIATGKYETVSSGEISLSIEKGEEIADGGVVTSGINRQGVKNLAEDIRYISLGAPGLRKLNSFFAGSGKFYILAAILVALFFLADYLVKFARERRADVAGSRNRRANKMARSRLKVAEEYLKKNLSGAYYEELHKALLSYVSSKLFIPAADLSKDTVRESLANHDVAAGTIDALLALVDKCEFARYSPDSEQVQMENEYNEAIRVISQLENQVKNNKTKSGGRKMAAVALLLCLGLSAFAQEDGSLGSLWNKGNEAFGQGQWQSAISCYKAIADSGMASADLFYNAGCAYFKNGDTAHAILYFEKALKLDPGHADAANNLAIAQQLTLDRIESVPQFVLAGWIGKVRHSMSADGWAWLTLGLLLAVLALLVVFRRSESLTARKLSFIFACVIAALTITTFSFSLAGRKDITRTDRAIVTVPVSSVKSSPADNGKSIFVLHEGTSVRILDNVGEWTKVEIADGRQGWLQTSAVEVI